MNRLFHIGLWIGTRWVRLWDGPPYFPKPPFPRPSPQGTLEASASPILRSMSRPRFAALRLAVRRSGSLPLRAGAAAIAASEGWLPAEACGWVAARKCHLDFLYIGGGCGQGSWRIETTCPVPACRSQRVSAAPEPRSCDNRASCAIAGQRLVGGHGAWISRHFSVSRLRRPSERLPSGLLGVSLRARKNANRSLRSARLSTTGWPCALPR
jgi:hypothetical protein